MITIKVSDLVSRVNQFLRQAVNLNNALISGELSNVKYVNGHCYFDLKDENGQLSCTLWRSYAARAGFRLEDGMAVLVHGSLNIYEKRGSLQLSVDSIEPAGIGALYLELERLKRQLAEEGCFDAARKKPKPSEINRIAVVTGPSTAALQDVMKTIRTRWPMLEVHLFPAPVQGKDAPAKICGALQKADQAGMDAVLLVRGGGSFEDLFCFNDPQIVHTLAGMKTYTVTGIGHEIDTSLADLAADHRALTPTAAAQWITPDQKEVSARLVQLEISLVEAANRLFERSTQKLMYLQASSPLADPAAWMESRKNRLEVLSHRLMSQFSAQVSDLEAKLVSLRGQLDLRASARLDQAARSRQALENALWIHSPALVLSQKSASLLAERQALKNAWHSALSQRRAQLDKYEALLQALSPRRILEQGYSIVLHEGRPVKSSAQLQPGDLLTLRFESGQAQASVVKTEMPS